MNSNTVGKIGDVAFPIPTMGVGVITVIGVTGLITVLPAEALILTVPKKSIFQFESVIRYPISEKPSNVWGAVKTISPETIEAEPFVIAPAKLKKKWRSQNHSPNLQWQ